MKPSRRAAALLFVLALALLPASVQPSSRRPTPAPLAAHDQTHTPGASAHRRPGLAPSAAGAFAIDRPTSSDSSSATSTPESAGNGPLDLEALLAGNPEGQFYSVSFSGMSEISFGDLIFPTLALGDLGGGRAYSMILFQDDPADPGNDLGEDDLSEDDPEIVDQADPPPDMQASPLTAGGAPVGANATATERPSISFDQQQANADSSSGDVTDDGNQIAFASSATNLVAGDTNNKADVFVRDRAGRSTTRISIATGGAQANNTSTNPQMGADGRFVVFESDATNLVLGDTNGARDIFLRDRQSNTTARLSISTIGLEPNGHCNRPRISADGRYIVFESDATNLTADDTNGVRDVFLRDRQTNQVTRVSLTAAGAQSDGASFDATVSDDGAIVCFTSDATNLVGGDTNGSTDVFFRNRGPATTARVSVGTGNAQGNSNSFSGRVSGDGRSFAFTSAATNMAPGDTNNTDDIFLRGRSSATTTRITMSPNQANAGSEVIAISADGRYIVYNSAADNLIAGDTNNASDVYIHDTSTLLTRRVSFGNAGQQPPGPCFATAVSSDGRFVIFSSSAASLVAGDTNAKADIFLRDLSKP